MNGILKMLQCLIPGGYLDRTIIITQFCLYSVFKYIYIYINQ